MTLLDTGKMIASVFGAAMEEGDITCWKHTTGILSFFSLTWGWLILNKPQILSGITVALAQVPEAVSFSFVAGVDPIIGLQSAWIMGIACTSLGEEGQVW